MPSQQEFTLDAIVEHARLGEEPSQEYLSSLTALDNVVRECMGISRSLRGLSTDNPQAKENLQKVYASIFLVALATRGVSLLNLAPNSRWASKIIEPWDYASMSGLVRTILELRLAFYYLCIEDCSKEEWQGRLDIFNLHGHVAQQRLAEAEEKVSPEHEKEADVIRGRLNKNEFFLKTFDPKEQKHLLRGRDAFIISPEEIAEKAGIDKKKFRWIYIMFSNHLHGLPMSVQRVGDDNLCTSRGMPGSEDDKSTVLALTFATSLFSQTRDEISKLFASELERGVEEFTSELDEAKEEIQTSNSFPVGDSMILMDNDFMKVKATLVSRDELHLFYYAPGNDHLVLQEIETEEFGHSLEFFDPVFWNIRLNGKAVTQAMLDELEPRYWAYKVDIENRSLILKIDGV